MITPYSLVNPFLLHLGELDRKSDSLMTNLHFFFQMFDLPGILLRDDLQTNRAMHQQVQQLAQGFLSNLGQSFDQSDFVISLSQLKTPPPPPPTKKTNKKTYAKHLTQNTLNAIKSEVFNDEIQNKERKS